MKMDGRKSFKKKKIQDNFGYAVKFFVNYLN